MKYKLQLDRSWFLHGSKPTLIFIEELLGKDVKLYGGTAKSILCGDITDERKAELCLRALRATQESLLVICDDDTVSSVKCTLEPISIEGYPTGYEIALYLSPEQQALWEQWGSTKNNIKTLVCYDRTPTAFRRRALFP